MLSSLSEASSEVLVIALAAYAFARLVLLLTRQRRHPRPFLPRCPAPVAAEGGSLWRLRDAGLATLHALVRRDTRDGSSTSLHSSDSGNASTSPDDNRREQPHVGARTELLAPRPLSTEASSESWRAFPRAVLARSQAQALPSPSQTGTGAPELSFGSSQPSVTASSSLVNRRHAAGAHHLDSGRRAGAGVAWVPIPPSAQLQPHKTASFDPAALGNATSAAAQAARQGGRVYLAQPFVHSAPIGTSKAGAHRVEPVAYVDEGLRMLPPIGWTPSSLPVLYVSNHKSGLSSQGDAASLSPLTPKAAASLPAHTTPLAVAVPPTRLNTWTPNSAPAAAPEFPTLISTPRTPLTRHNFRTSDSSGECAKTRGCFHVGVGWVSPDLVALDLDPEDADADTNPTGVLGSAATTFGFAGASHALGVSQPLKFTDDAERAKEGTTVGTVQRALGKWMGDLAASAGVLSADWVHTREMEASSAHCNSRVQVPVPVKHLATRAT